MSNIEPLRPFLLWTAVIGNGLAKRLLALPLLSDDHLASAEPLSPPAPPSAPLNKAPNGSLHSTTPHASPTSDIGLTMLPEHTDEDRLSMPKTGARPTIGVRIGIDCNSTLNSPARCGSDPASPHDCDPELSRRNRPITDLTGLGLDSPPIHVWFVLDFFRVWYVIEANARGGDFQQFKRCAGNGLRFIVCLTMVW